MHLLDFLFPPRVDEKIIRDLTPDRFLTLLKPRLVPVTRPATTALFPFSTHEVRGAIHEAKYHGNRHAFTLLGAAVADYLSDTDENFGFATSTVLVPIPLSKERFGKRGYNQAHEIALCAAREVPLPIETGLLVRTHDTASQVSLERAKRESNMQNAFTAVKKADPALTYVLLDDVITTGATLNAALAALQSAGARTIIPLALAH